jgi:hypothetical protein
MLFWMILLLLVGGLGSAQRATVPACESQQGRQAEPIHGAINRGDRFSQNTLWLGEIEYKGSASGIGQSPAIGGRHEDPRAALRFAAHLHDCRAE